MSLQLGCLHSVDMNGYIADGRFAAASVQQAQKAQVKGQMFVSFRSFLDRLDIRHMFQGNTDVQSLIKCLEYRMTGGSQAKVVVSCATMHSGQ